jgi:hypothetical protein
MKIENYNNQIIHIERLNTELIKNIFHLFYSINLNIQVVEVYTLVCDV